MACAVTALPILVLFLEELGLLGQPLGQRVLRYASLDDVAIWAVLAAILLDAERLGRQAGFAVVFAGAAWGMRRLLPRLPAADRLPVALVWLAASAFAADWSGLHYMVGAFLAGAVLEADWLDRARLGQLRQTVLMLMMPVFFLSTGLRTGWEMGGLGVVAAAALLLAAAVGGKLLGLALAGRWLGWPRGEAWTIGWLLQTKALIMIIFVTILLDRGILSGAAFTALLLMAVGSTTLTMPVVGRRRLAPDTPPI
jgi:Kef-type K+ transport system membrane component KefB